MTEHRFPTVYYSNGSFLIFKAEDAIELRRKRILAQPVNGVVSGNVQGGFSPPFSLSPYAVHAIAELGLVKFLRLDLKPEISILENKSFWEHKSAEFSVTARDLFVRQRMSELSKRNIVLAQGRDYSSEFDETKMRLAISGTINPHWSSYEERLMHAQEVKLIIKNELAASEQKGGIVDREFNKLLVFRDLHRRGFYISSGAKFGSDFLAYAGDPVAYHSQYAVIIVERDERGQVDLNQIEKNQINCLQRLAHTANKIPLFTTVQIGREPQSATIDYWTLPERVYLNPNSKNTEFSRLEPEISSRGVRNKVRPDCS